MADLTPAATLRAAATLIRETASKATPGPWEDTPDALWFGGQVWGYRIRKDGNFPVGDSGSPDPAWIALMSPAIAEHLFAWLERAERDMSGAEVVVSKMADFGDDFDPIEFCDEPDSVRAALAFARSILGRTS